MNFPSKKISDGVFEGVELSEPSAYQDHRGYYYTIYDDDNRSYVKDKLTTSSKDVLRGIHGDYKSTKLLTCVHGEVYCVIVDYRKDSENYLTWRWLMLTCSNKKSIIIPPGVGLSYLVMSEYASVLYQLSYSGDY